MPYKSPLTREQYDMIKRDQKKLVDILDGITRAESCGIDCEGQKGAAQSLQKALEQYEQQFASPPPK